jgi:phage repressor protein C with HTH and peptisase S24 domain
MIRHEDIWRAIDALAAEKGLSASGLAKKAGLDATTFNKSKRAAALPGGGAKPRWPSTESVAKILAATGTSMESFTALVTGQAREPARASAAAAGRRIPLIGFAQAGASGYFDDAGYPVGGSWDEIAAPDLVDPHAYAVEITGDSMEPVYRDGDVVLVSPAAPVRRGDRVVVRLSSGEVTAKELARQTARRIELASLNPAHALRAVDVGEVAWMHRIVWASQ